MALIPNKSKTNTIDDSGIGIEVITIIFAIVVVGNKLFEEKVHPWLSWVLIVIMGIIGAYIIFPSSKNHGRIGYFRLLNLLRFKIINGKKKRKLKR